jgi:hypothetical protein
VVGDSVTTAAWLSAGAAEWNPVAATVLAVAGRLGMVLVEAGVVALYGLYVAFDRTTPYDIDDEAALFVAGLGLIVTVWNLAVIAAEQR